MENKDKVLQEKNKEKQITAYDVEMRKLDIREKKEEEAKKFKQENKYKLIFLVLCILTIASLFDYGFFRTLGIWIVLSFCYILGGWFDKDSKVVGFVVKLIRKFQ